MKGRTRSVTLVALIALAQAAAGGAYAGESGWTVKKVLTQMDRVVRSHVGVSGTIEYEEIYRSRSVKGSGTIRVRFDGRVRAEIGGGLPRTFLLRPPYLQIYYPVDESVEILTVGENPDMLAQYALLGFAPAGSGLKKDYKVTVFEQAVVDGREMVVLDLAPKSKRVAEVVTTLRLWVDTESWLPAAELVYHKPSGIQLSVHYSGVTPEKELPDSVFKPDWPEGTRIIQR